MKLHPGSFNLLINLGCGEYSPVLKGFLARRYKGASDEMFDCCVHAHIGEGGEEGGTASLSPFTFSKEQVRVLLFRECDWRGRKLLFDSKAVHKVKQESQTCKLSFSSLQQTEKSKRPDTFVEVTNGIGYQYTRPTSDITMLGEMMFGSVAMSFQGSAFKVHHLKSPTQLMCSKVFPSPIYHQRTKYTRDCSFEDSYDSSLQYLSDCFPSHSINSCSRIANQSRNTSESCPLDVPYCVGQTIEVDSGFYGDASTCSISSEIYDWGSPGTAPTSLDSGRSSKSYAGNSLCHSTGSLASLQRRWLRNMSTSLEHENSGSSLGSNTGVVEPGSLSCPRRTKLGLAVIITMTSEEEQEMQIFFFDHMVVIETMIERLWCFVARAYAQKETFVHIMVEGCEAAQQVNMVVGMDLIYQLAGFVSTLLTAVLTHHLGWVGTVLHGKIAPNMCKNSGTGQLGYWKLDHN
uniref:UDENN FNIP1/2-type domain-containing protein n=1 Tax=Timema cristinae TaxID=61476 RepID=A0A7R9GVZ9_TIMCR|nr:unnamed protein product [Timema cristinae]